jgi:hypothetical protein
MAPIVRPPDQPLAWIGKDRLLLNDQTIYGLRRKVFARKDDLPNMVGLLQVAYQEARNAQVHWWLVEKNDFYYLWIVWKEGR